MNPITRREAIVSGAKLAGLLSISGFAGLEALACGPQTNTPQSNAVPTGTINVWQHASPVYNKLYKQLAAQYQQTYPKVTITDLIVPYAELETKVLTAFTGGTPPDVVKLGGWELPNYAAKRLLANVDPAALGASSLAGVKSKYAPGGLEALTFSNKLYGLPIDFNSVFFYYRPDHFQQAGLDPTKPPTTWEEVVQYGQQLTQRGTNGQLKRAGFQLWYGVPIWDLLYFLPLIAGAGGSLISSDGKKGTLNTPAGIKALTYYAGLSTTAKVGSPDFTDPGNNYGQLAKGTASMTISANFAAAIIAAAGNKLGQTFAVAKLPQWAGASKSVASGYSWGWAVAEKSTNRFTAWHFLNYLQSPANVDQQLSTAGLVTPVSNWQNLSSATASPGAQIMASQLPYTDFGPRLPNWNQFAKLLSDNLVAAAHGTKSPAQAASDFDSGMVDVLA